MTLDLDSYFIRFDNAHASTPDASGEPVYYLSGRSKTKGVEAGSTIYKALSPNQILEFQTNSVRVRWTSNGSSSWQ